MIGANGMMCGDIYLWVTDKAKRYDTRRKYHVYICDAGWRAQGHAFLFISKSDYGGDFLINKFDYNFFTLETSYISCSNIVTYSDNEIQSAKPEKIGALTKEHMRDLFNSIARSETMEQWQIKLVCEALRSAF